LSPKPSLTPLTLSSLASLCLGSFIVYWTLFRYQSVKVSLRNVFVLSTI
jgi:hypothetical protein